MSITVVYDCTGDNLGSFPIPPGVLMAGYMTGSGGVPWTREQFNAHPGAIHIDQSAFITGLDETADVIDYEDGAAVLSDLAPWVNAAHVKFNLGIRAGQRKPAIYASASNITAVVNELISKGITSGVGLWVANWNLTDPQAVADVNNASGPFPIIGVQFANAETHDISVFSTAWLQEVSKVSVPTPPPPLPPASTPTPVPSISIPQFQANWHFCHKCQGIFYFPGEAESHCPAGGTHDGSHSHDFAMIFIQ